MTRRVYQTLLLLFLIAFTYLFAREVQVQSIRITHLDKLAHFAVFFMLAFFSYHAFKFKPWFHMVLLTSYGACIEWMQSTIPYRQASMGDFIADVLGALSYFVLLWLMRKYQARKSS
ncbi:hypothetical protein N474_21685 [Pseudoalteromonas luteoviolacea CPMOR-2]|uniref:VanZ-like domain-containing protein n=1 Tax=Pseudoalteromonas luteoviolacea DSM 6061 TaxID=1365250 RepID=A0A166XK67_9GAMM|nr:VanZ family protein [Pseudoalteromonas luteoviolacea]KZN40466.1 hypothetical protein N475_11855 [Pseudoalteromonas luteoviolacea DSM 6061]KZN53137.1 hypothetical protein N474_21685 [Pseudoalteromonas luteoviolacea CPMOR-2]MBE0387335.1 hypothetical protein [Pseudoalteromonas luteoviolacea DSM 6061]